MGIAYDEGSQIDQTLTRHPGADRSCPDHRGRKRLSCGTALGLAFGQGAKAEVSLFHQQMGADEAEVDDAGVATDTAVEANRVGTQTGAKTLDVEVAADQAGALGVGWYQEPDFPFAVVEIEGQETLLLFHGEEIYGFVATALPGRHGGRPLRLCGVSPGGWRHSAEQEDQTYGRCGDQVTSHCRTPPRNRTLKFSGA